MIKDSAIETLKIEAASVTKLIERIDDEFVAAVNCILDCHARVVVTGMGKSGHIGRKIAASLASTGTPAFMGIWVWLLRMMWLLPYPIAVKAQRW